MGQQHVLVSELLIFCEAYLIDWFRLINYSGPEAKRSNLDQAETIFGGGPNSCMLQNAEMSSG